MIYRTIVQLNKRTKQASVKILSIAKINLGLRILERRKDGYHNITSLLLPIGLSDELSVEASEELLFSTSGSPIPGKSSENLCIKAFELIKRDYPIPNVRMHLHKNIPTGSGLGGASSNAAFTLKALNTLFKLHLNQQQLTDYAKLLGSDCAFFIENKTALAQGKGDLLSIFPFDLQQFEVMLVWPGISISTASAYAEVIPSKDGNLLRPLLSLPAHEWQGKIENDFSVSLFQKYPELQSIQEALLSKGAVYASLSGSGSAIFAFFKKGEIPIMEWPSNYFVWKGEVLVSEEIE